MMKVLVPVDGSSTSARAVRHVIALAKGGEPMEVHLINVQEKADSLALGRFLKPAEIRHNQLAHGEAILAPGKKLLERAGLSCKTHVLIGDPAEKITTLAKRGGFSQIVMSTHGRTGMAALLMGSIATKVLHHATVPVTLVK